MINKIVKLVKGGLIVQLIPFLAAPVITRIYSPSILGNNAKLMAFVLMLSVMTSIRVDQIIILSTNNDERKRLLYLGVVNSIIYTFIVGVIIIAIIGRGDLLKIGDIRYYIYICILIFMQGLISISDGFIMSHQKYTLRNSIQITHSCASSLGIIVFGYIGLGLDGMILGYLVAGLITIGIYTYSVINEIQYYNIDWRTIVDEFKIRKKNIIANSTGAILNSINNNGRIVFLGLMVSPIFLGYYSLAYRVIQAPVSVLTTAISNVIYKETGNLILSNQIGKLKYEIIKITKKTSILSLGIVIVTYSFGQNIFSFAFGGKWGEAGRYAEILSVAMLTMLLGTSLCKVLWVLNKNKIYNLWELGRLVLFGLMVYGAQLIGKEDDILLIWSISIVQLISYSVVILLVMHYVKKKMVEDER